MNEDSAAEWKCTIEEFSYNTLLHTEYDVSRKDLELSADVFFKKYFLFSLCICNVFKRYLK